MVFERMHREPTFALKLNFLTWRAHNITPGEQVIIQEQFSQTEETLECLE